MKTYKVEIIYTESEKESESLMQTFVDNERAPLPLGLKKWIAKQLIEEK